MLTADSKHSLSTRASGGVAITGSLAVAQGRERGDRDRSRVAEGFCSDMRAHAMGWRVYHAQPYLAYAGARGLVLRLDNSTEWAETKPRVEETSRTRWKERKQAVGTYFSPYVMDVACKWHEAAGLGGEKGLSLTCRIINRTARLSTSV